MFWNIIIKLLGIEFIVIDRGNMKNSKITVEHLKDKVKNFYDKEERTFLLVSFIAGMFAHLYGIVNNINNYDSIRNNWYGDGVSSGRWFLQVLGSVMDQLDGNWDVSFFNGIITIAILSLTAGMIPKIFNVKNNKLSILGCILFMVYPTTTSMIFFSYTAVYYSIGVYMAVFAVYIINKRYIGGILASFLITYATGIYQANYTISVAFIVLLLIEREINIKKFKLTDEIKIILKYICVLAVSIIHYYIMVKLTIYVSEDTLTDYQGINDLGLKRIGDVPGIITDTWWRYFEEIFGWGENSYGISLTTAIRISSYVLFFISVLLVFICILSKKNVMQKIMVLSLIFIWPFAVNSINFACYGKWIYTLMVYALYASFLLPIILLDWFIKEKEFNFRKVIYKKIVTGIVELFIAMVCLNYIYQSNGNYEVAKYTDQKVTNRIMLILSQVYNIEGYKPGMKIVFINPYNTLVDSDLWGDSPFVYGGNGDYINSYTINYFSETYIGLDPNIVTEYMGGEENRRLIKECYEDEYISGMPGYPESGSIKIYDGKVIVKFNSSMISNE